MSDYFAFSSIDTAIDRTKSLLWPFNKGIWLRIALISLFLGGTSFINPFQFTSGPGDIPVQGAGPELFMEELPLILAIIGIIIVLALVLAYISSVFQFLFVDCLSRNEFSIRKYFMSNTGRGARLFGFNLILGILFLLAIIAPVLLIFAATGDIFGAPKLSLILAAFLAAFLISLPFMIIMLFTVDFVVPIMLKDNCGIIAGWKKCWEVIGRDWWQTVVYLVMKVILSIVVSIIMLVLIMIAALVIAIPFVVAGLVIAGLIGGFALPVLFLILLIVYIICIIPAALLINVPFVTFLRYYSLDVLGNLDEKYVMIS